MLGYSAPSTIPAPDGTFSESCPRDLFNDTLFGTDTRLMWSNRAFKLGPGGVLSCVTYGSCEARSWRITGGPSNAWASFCLLIAPTEGCVHTTPSYASRHLIRQPSLGIVPNVKSARKEQRRLCFGAMARASHRIRKLT